MIVHPYLNHGRWLVDCPKHGQNGAHEVAPETTEYIAPCCYPGVIATFTGMVKGHPQVVPDVSARATATARAKANGEIHTVVFPENTDEIMEVISMRPIPDQNWQPNESVELMLEQNAEKGII